MDELRIGDHVEVEDSSKNGSPRYSRVISFSHFDPKSEANYLQIYTTPDEEGVPLEISEDHMVMMGSRSTRRAGDLRVGDTLSNGHSVRRIDTVQRRGLYAPLTEAGTIVVSGVQASSYVALLKLPATLQHHSYHIAMGPLRLLCRYDFEYWCAGESYTDGGISTYIFGIVQLVLPIARYSVAAQFLFGVLVGLPLMMIAFLCEHVMALPVASLVLGMYYCYRVTRGRTKKQKSF
jgi:Hint module